MEVLKLLRALMRFFLPPKSSEPEPVQLGWRYKVASTLGTLVVSVVLICLLSTGQFPSISTGFATADTESTEHARINKRIDDQKQDIDAIRQGLSDMRQDQIDTRLYDTRGRQCAAMVTKNDQALRSEGKRLLEDLPKYRSLAKEDWRIPPCNEY